MLALLFALQVSTAGTPTQSHYVYPPDGGPVMVTERAPSGKLEQVVEPYPRLVGSPVMQKMMSHCDQYRTAKTAQQREAARQALVDARANYQGDLSQEVYQCMIAAHAIRTQ